MPAYVPVVLITGSILNMLKVALPEVGLNAAYKGPAF